MIVARSSWVGRSIRRFSVRALARLDRHRPPFRRRIAIDEIDQLPRDAAPSNPGIEFVLNAIRRAPIAKRVDRAQLA